MGITKAFSFQGVVAVITILIGSLSHHHVVAFHSSRRLLSVPRRGPSRLRQLSRFQQQTSDQHNDILLSDDTNSPPTVQFGKEAFDIVAPESTPSTGESTISSVQPEPADPIAKNSEKKNISWTCLQQRIVRRLNTYEDYMGVHKISAAIWLLSLLYICGVGVSNEFSDIPESLGLVTWIALVTSFVQGVTGYDMAIKHRAHDPVVQMGMINTSFQMMSVAMAGFYISPFAPETFNDFHLGNGLLVTTNAPTVIMGLGEIFKMKKIVESRRLRKKEPSSSFTEDFETVVDLSSYGFASVSGFVGATLGIVFAANPCHDRAWVLSAASRGAFPCPNFIPENYYATSLFNLAIGVGVFAITLRDKKLISKSVEQTLVAFFTLPAAFLTLHSSPF